MKLIIGGAFLIILMILSITYFCLPKIEININGKRNINLLLGEDYVEEGATAYYKSIKGTKEIDVKITGNVKKDSIGKYIITYTSTYKNLKKEVIRVINVIDNIKPEITLLGDVTACKNNNTLNYDISAYDNYDGNITDKIKYSIDNDNITFSVVDSANNKNELTKKINYIDKDKPVITLNGSSTISLVVGDAYSEYGASAYDTCDGDISSNIKIDSNIDINVIGKYEVKYSVVDSEGISTEVIRYVNVVEKENLISKYQVEKEATIYLTFDDGPGPYTEELLNILDKYNIKATFFVTMQFPKYKYLIKEEYTRGHKIGVHTYTHKWSIYSSQESYLEDFNKINNIIYEETGEYTNIFRFPGGSSNTVSRNYKKGIMSTLANLMQNNGYTYYDWTFDSGDTSKTNNSVEAIIENVKNNLKGDGEYIILMHDIKKNTIEALPKIIEFAQYNGYTFDKINEKTNIPHFKIAN